MPKILPGQIYDVPFPYLDKPDTFKYRPSLVISKEETNIDKVIVAYITSTDEKRRFHIPIPLNMQKPITLQTCGIITNRLVTIDVKMLKNYTCTLKPEFLEKVLEQIKSHF